jgi:hypothetical protein
MPFGFPLSAPGNRRRLTDDQWILGTVHVGKAMGDRDPEPDSDLHRRRAEADAEMEEHDIDDMIDAIAERRRRAGRRDVGEELADELLRGGWDKGV